VGWADDFKMFGVQRARRHKEAVGRSERIGRSIVVDELRAVKASVWCEL
jgi:hypothetical protein